LAQDDPSLALGTSSMTLLELTSAYAAMAANSYPVEPRAIAAEEEGWFDWLFSPQRSFNDRVHADMEEMLRFAVNAGTGRNARLSIANYGKTGTSQDNRDAIFVGYAGGLIVGVWVGNDDNTPLKGVNGGTTPARIWRDFMQQAVKGAGGSNKPSKPKSKPAPDSPIEKLDLPEIPELPTDINIGGTDVKLNEEDGLTITTDLEGVPLDIRVGRDGIDVNPSERDRERESSGRR
jgi:penicillin-binding protein 1A